MFAVSVPRSEPHHRRQFAVAQVAEETARIFDVPEFAVLLDVGKRRSGFQMPGVRALCGFSAQLL